MGSPAQSRVIILKLSEFLRNTNLDRYCASQGLHTMRGLGFYLVVWSYTMATAKNYLARFKLRIHSWIFNISPINTFFKTDGHIVKMRAK